MTGRYLVEVADWLRAEGLAVVEYSGWQTRARGSGGFAEGRPWAIMWHHTASQAPIENDAAYCAEGDPDAPVCNLLIARDGAVWVIAAGASNTNGKGYALTFSRGTVPNDQMNTHAIGVEICNSGVGEVYPAAQIEAAFVTSLALCGRLGLAADDVATHVAWAPDRKIDPATADAASGFYPRSINASGSWALDDLRAECLERAGTPAPLPPTPHPGTPAPPLTIGDRPMIVALDSNGTAWIGDGMTRDNPTEDTFANLVILGKNEALRFVNVNGDAVAGWGDVVEVGDNMIEALGRRL